MRKLTYLVVFALALGFVADASACPLGRVLGLVRGGAAKAKSGLGRTRFFDGDGQPLRKAR